jgi:hypothetical protein
MVPELQICGADAPSANPNPVGRVVARERQAMPQCHDS